MASNDTQVSGMAGRYGSAIFSLAQEEGKQDQVLNDLNDFLHSYYENSELQQFAKSQAISKNDKLAAMTKIVNAAKMDTISANFLRLIATKGRLPYVEDIILAYYDLVKKDRNVIEAEVTVAKPLTAEQEKTLSASLNEKFNKSVDMDIMVKPAILGGIIIKVGSKMIDNSLRTKLDNLKIAMKEAS